MPYHQSPADIVNYEVHQFFYMATRAHQIPICMADTATSGSKTNLRKSLQKGFGIKHRQKVPKSF